MTIVTHLAAALHLHSVIEGQGQAYLGDQRLADVEYTLKDVEEVLGPTELEGGDGRPRVVPARTLYGLLRSRGDDALGQYVGAQLTLRLDDGRTLACAVTKQLNVGIFLVRAFGVPR